MPDRVLLCIRRTYVGYVEVYSSNLFVDEELTFASHSSVIACGNSTAMCTFRFRSRFIGANSLCCRRFTCGSSFNFEATYITYSNIQKKN